MLPGDAIEISSDDDPPDPDFGFNRLLTMPVPEFAQPRNLLRPICLKNLLKISTVDLIKKMQKAGVLYREMICHMCGENCKMALRTDVDDGCCWRCSNNQCSRPRISIRKGSSSFFLLFFLPPFLPAHPTDSFFSGSKLPLSDLVALVYCLLLFRKMSHVNMRQILDIEENTISSWWIKIKDQIVSFFDSSPLKLGLSFFLSSRFSSPVLSSPVLSCPLLSSPLLSSSLLLVLLFFFTHPPPYCQPMPNFSSPLFPILSLIFQEIAKLTNPSLERSENTTVENVCIYLSNYF